MFLAMGYNKINVHDHGILTEGIMFLTVSYNYKNTPDCVL